MSTPSTTARGAGMPRFSDLKLRAKMVAFAALAALATLAVGLVGQTALGGAQASIVAVADADAKPAVSLGQAATYFARYRRFTVTAAASPDATKAKAALDAAKATAAKTAAAMDDFAGSPADEDAKKALETVRGKFTALNTLWETTFTQRAIAATTPEQVQALLDDLDADFGPKADEVTKGFDDLIAKNVAAIDADVADAKTAAGRAVLMLWAGVAVGVALVVLFGLWISNQVTRPVLRVKNALQSLGDGDLTVRAEVDTADEVGEMAAALGRAQTNLRDALSRISTSSTTLAGAAEELSAVSSQVSASAEETSAQSGTAAAAAEQVSRNVQTVAAATEQMSSSIREISSSSADAVRVAQSAATEAVLANATVAKLGDSSREIGDVVKVITSIAEQTNLLALNATIEAARAGEAGKGFAVVASEVKDLAQETARATEDIGRRIEAIQADTDAAVAAIARIATIIDEVNTYQTTIASAVEEQTATTGEMARSVSEAATGAGGIAGSIEYVASAAQSSSTGIAEAQRAASELAQLSSELRELVSTFRI